MLTIWCSYNIVSSWSVFSNPYVPNADLGKFDVSIIMYQIKIING